MMHSPLLVQPRSASRRRALPLAGLLAAVTLLALVACSSGPSRGGAAAVAPVAPIEVTVRDAGGERFEDPYFWLRKKEDPRTIAYLEAENAHAEALMAPTRGLQEKLYREMRSRLKEDDAEAPYQKGNAWYYARFAKGKPYPLVCRRVGSVNAREEVILDGNALAKGKDYFRLGAASVSDDGRLLAFSTDYAGSERYTLRFKDLATGKVAADEVPDTYYTSAWAADNRTYFYVTIDAASRPYRVWRHTLGTPASQDVLVYEETDERFFVTVDRSRSGGVIFINSGSQKSNEWRFIDASRPTEQPTIIAARRDGVEYSVDHHPGVTATENASGAARGTFYILTNDGAFNFRLVEAPVSSPGAANWRTVVPERPDVSLDAVNCFAGHLVLSVRNAGLPALEVRRLPDLSPHFVEQREASYSLGLGDNEVFSTTTLRFDYESLVTPASVFDYDMNARTRVLIKERPVLGGYDRTRYVTERVMAPAPDGTLVPVSLVYRKGLVRDGSNPAYIEGYGSYGYAFDAGFDPNIISLLDRGVVYGIAHIRGGSELGRGWYEAGRLRNKRNTFTDFIAACDYLVSQKYTSPQRLAVEGRSAGGLLMGAIANMRPDLFNTIVAGVPFVDVMNTMIDPTIPLTVTEWEQWGDPRQSEDYAYMRSYSPYDNVSAKAYPNMLVLAGLNDPRVAYWEPAKWTARLRSLKTDSNLLLLKTNMGAGHGGASDRFEKLRELAFQYAFALRNIGAERTN